MGQLCAETKPMVFSDSAAKTEEHVCSGPWQSTSETSKTSEEGKNTSEAGFEKKPPK
jgi:hypothetical protein